MRSAVLLAAVAAFSGPAMAGELVVQDAFSRATPGTGPGVAYLTIKGGDEADRLLSASSPRAKAVELHGMEMQGSVMRMRAVPAVDVPANGTVALAPGGSLHLMLMGLAAPLKTGERVPLVLHFAKAGDKAVDAVVGTPGQASMPAVPR